MISSSASIRRLEPGAKNRIAHYSGARGVPSKGIVTIRSDSSEELKRQLGEGQFTARLIGDLLEVSPNDHVLRLVAASDQFQSMLFPNFSSGWSTFDLETEVPDLHGKVFLVTGANSGLGFTTVEELVKKGAKVYLGARNEERGRSAMERIRNSISALGNPGIVEWLPLDVSTPRLAKAAAAAFLVQESRLDVLIHNAAVLSEDYETVQEGGIVISRCVSTNHLGPFVLTKELLPTMQTTAKLPGSDVRIVVVSSDMHLSVLFKPNYRTLEGWNYSGSSFFRKSQRYSISKLANILFVRELQRRLDEEDADIIAMAIHPGLAYTEGNIRTLSANPVIGTIMIWVIMLIGLTARQGAFTSLFAATSPRVKANPKAYRGRYIRPYDRVGKGSNWSTDAVLASDLWRCSEELEEVCLR